MGPHTTSDDPSRYVDPAERAEWAAKDPIDRLERHLDSLGLLTDELRASVAASADAAAAELRRACLALAEPEALSVFDDVYAEPHTGLERQRREYSAYLAMFEGGAS
jgi:2-oxoisovalerate dehydrogenase E1 component alpha subunit